MTDTTIQPDAHVEGRLRDDLIAWLVTVRPSGQPDATPIWFVWHEGKLVIYSKPSQTKLSNLATNPRVTVVLDDTRGGGDVTRILGTAEHDGTHPAAHEIPAYVEKYGEHMAGVGFPDTEAFAADYSAPIVITPTRLQSFHP